MISFNIRRAVNHVECITTHNLVSAVYLLQLLGDLQCSVWTTIIYDYNLVVEATALKHVHLNKNALFKTNGISFFLRDSLIR